MYGVENMPYYLQNGVTDILVSLYNKTPIESAFFKPINGSLDFLNITSKDKEKIISDAEIIIEELVLPAYRDLEQFIVRVTSPL